MKVAIIGAGISGLYLAWKLAERGEEITVFEKKEKIGKEVCSGLFSERILEFIPQSQSLIQNQIDYCLIHFPKRTLEIKFSGKFFVMSHCELDRLVASLAEKSGAKIILNYNVTKQGLVTFQNGFGRVIGCDGALSQVRKSLGLKDPQFYLGIQGFLLRDDFSNYVETWPTNFAPNKSLRDYTGQGFIWKIPRGKEGDEAKASSSRFATARVIEYGIIEKPEKAKGIFNQFLKEKNLNLERMNSALIPQGLIIPKNQKITLCGDAAGLTKPWSGGGVIWSLISANILLRNFPDFLKYQKEIKKIFLSKIIFSKIAKKVVYFLGFKCPWFLPKSFKVEGDFLM